jgi:hypothetical protein
VKQDLLQQQLHLISVQLLPASVLQAVPDSGQQVAQADKLVDHASVVLFSVAKFAVFAQRKTL